jgi:hypothetical protein
MVWLGTFLSIPRNGKWRVDPKLFSGSCRWLEIAGPQLFLAYLDLLLNIRWLNQLSQPLMFFQKLTQLEQQSFPAKQLSTTYTTYQRPLIL